MGITRREHQILSELIEQGRLRGAANALGIAESTAKNHMTNLRRRLGASSTYQVVYRLGAGELDHLLPDDDEDGADV